MPSPVAARLLEIFAAARGEPDAFLRLDPGKLRFSLGTSLADFAVPVQVAADAVQITRAAAVELGLLLASVHRAHLAADDVDRLILREDYARLPTLPPPGAVARGGPDLRAAVEVGPALHPSLAGEVVAAWLGRGGRGRSLVALWIELLRQAFAEMERTRGQEETPLLVVHALSSATAGAGEALREVLPSPPLDRQLRAAAMAGIWLAGRTGLSRVFREQGREATDPLLKRAEAAHSPSLVLGGRAAVLQGGITLYGLELAAGVPRADDLAARLCAGSPAEEAAAGVRTALRAEPDLSRRAEAAAALGRLRELLARGLEAGEAVGLHVALARLREALHGPGALPAALSDDASRKALLHTLQVASPRGEVEPLERAAEALRAFRAKDPGAAVGLGREEAREEYAAASSALIADLAVGRLALAARRPLSHRTGREAEGGADAEWENGRLYRLSARGGAILHRREERRAGQLFVDVKDFTRRTATLGEASMAEFLRREFYGPILGAAKEYFGGMGHLADRGGVALNNLLGDAVSFTGRIDVLVSLAKAIRGHLASYSMRLSRELSSEAVARQLSAIEEAQGAALSLAQAGRVREEALLTAEPPGTPGHALALDRLRRARVEEARLAAERERQLARARGEALEAGAFLSFGAEPLVVVIEDEVFGRNRVAIAERINESARGTARAPAARLRADAALVAERARRNSASLSHAWRVFVGQPLRVEVPPEAEAAALRHWRAGERVEAMRALAGPARAAVSAAAAEAEAGEGPPGDIYNGGTALSEEALDVFLVEVQKSREVRRLTLRPEDVPERLKERWFFGDESQELVVCGQGVRVLELFRRVGRAAFKGLGGVVVWELCPEDGGPGALARELGPRWLGR